MKERGWIVLFGGTGYIGEKLARLLLSQGYRVLIVTRQKETGSFEKRLFSQFVKDKKNRLLIWNKDVFELSFSDLTSLQVTKYGIYAVINLVTSTTGSGRTIIKDNVFATNKILALVYRIKAMWSGAMYIQLGSITELSYKNNSIYSKAKKEVKKVVQDSSLCDYHLVFGFTYGGNPRMISDLSKIFPFCFKYRRLLHGFQMACIHVEDLVEKIASLLKYGNDIKDIHYKKEFPLEVRVIGEDFDLYQLLAVCFKQEELLTHQTPYLSSYLEKVMLFFHYVKYRLTSFQNTFHRRMSFFCKLALLRDQKEKQAQLNYYQSLGNKKEIMKLIQESPNKIKVLEDDHSQIVFGRNGLIYIL